MTDWVSDTNGNRCSVQYFGSREAAQRALDSLENCKKCTNCSDCSGCSDCSDCSRCSDCSDCSRCSRCSRCSGCSDCSDCSGCSDCSDCSRCSDCSDCSRCSRCSRCSGCSDCSRCSGCSGCSRCSRCSRCSGCSRCQNVAYLIAKKGVRAEGPSMGTEAHPAPGVPTTPKIENIHQKVFAAVSQPEALDMATWHTCNTTHCRGGWVVHLAGAPGYDLERFHGTALAAQLIYRESGHLINPRRFYDNNEDALADMKRLADGEAAP